MRVILPVLTAFLCAAVLAPAQQRRPITLTPNPSGFEMRRGVNLSHWLSQCFGWSPRATFITERDIAFIASLGYDHVRIPIDEKELWAEDGTPSAEAFAYLTRCLDWCVKHKLKAVIDLHVLRAHYFNAPKEGGKITLWTDPAAQENLLKLWKDLGERIGRFPVDQLAYEIMNEPVADDHEDWNRLVARAITSIRSREPGRVLVVGSNIWQTPPTFPFLKVPENDRNIILSVHTYAPMAFTHHKASWTPLKTYTGPVRYPGQPIADEDLARYADRDLPQNAGDLREARLFFDRQRLQEVLAPAVARAKELKLQLYCGEFGCLPTVDRKQRLAYYTDIVSVFEANDMAWANWDYKGDFGIVSFDREKARDLGRDEGLIQALLGTARPVPAFPPQP
jgi:endoglucanase